MFPVQRLVGLAGRTVRVLHARWQRSGIRAVLRRPTCSRSEEIAFLVSASHTPEEIDRALAIMERAA